MIVERMCDHPKEMKNKITQVNTAAGTNDGGYYLVLCDYADLHCHQCDETWRRQVDSRVVEVVTTTTYLEEDDMDFLL